MEDSTVAETTLSPRLAANFHISPTQTVRAAVSRGYRNPALFEENANTTVYDGYIGVICILFDDDLYCATFRRVIMGIA